MTAALPQWAKAMSNSFSQRMRWDFNELQHDIMQAVQPYTIFPTVTWELRPAANAEREILRTMAEATHDAAFKARPQGRAKYFPGFPT
jgi:hypothetical protein